MSDTDRKVEADWSREEGNTFFWVAWVDNPGMPEPHCYGNSVGYDGDAALPHIERASKFTGDALMQYLKETYLVG